MIDLLTILSCVYDINLIKEKTTNKQLFFQPNLSNFKNCYYLFMIHFVVVVIIHYFITSGFRGVGRATCRKKHMHRCQGETCQG